jgi:hypothetical protein
MLWADVADAATPGLVRKFAACGALCLEVLAPLTNDFSLFPVGRTDEMIPAAHKTFRHLIVGG